MINCSLYSQSNPIDCQDQAFKVLNRLGLNEPTKWANNLYSVVSAKEKSIRFYENLESSKHKDNSLVSFGPDGFDEDGNRYALRIAQRVAKRYPSREYGYFAPPVMMLENFFITFDKTKNCKVVLAGIQLSVVVLEKNEEQTVYPNYPILRRYHNYLNSKCSPSSLPPGENMNFIGISDAEKNYRNIFPNNFSSYLKRDDELRNGITISKEKYPELWLESEKYINVGCLVGFASL